MIWIAILFALSLPVGVVGLAFIYIVFVRYFNCYCFHDEHTIRAFRALSWRRVVWHTKIFFGREEFADGVEKRNASA